jgi:hypothetical protein
MRVRSRTNTGSRIICKRFWKRITALIHRIPPFFKLKEGTAIRRLQRSFKSIRKLKIVNYHRLAALEPFSWPFRVSLRFR